MPDPRGKALRRTAFVITMAALATIQAPVSKVEAQDFSMSGPYTVGSLSQRVTITPTGETEPVALDVIVTYPTDGPCAGAYPTVAMFNGFQAKAPWYTGVARRTASWGYVILQYTLPGMLPIVVDRTELTYLQPLLDWLRTQGSAPASPLYGKADVARLATMGHSRGGKLAALHYAGRPDVATAVLLDPIDGSDMTPHSVDYPSAVDALCDQNKTAAIIGAGITGRCNPTAYNYPHFWGVLGSSSWQVVVQQAGHMQFATTGNPVTDWALSALCKRGAIATSDVISIASTVATAWLEATFRGPQSATGLNAFRTWLDTQAARKVITFALKP